MKALLKREVKRLVRSASRGLGLPSTLLGSPRGLVASTREWVEQHPEATFQELRFAETIERSLPHTLNAETRALFGPHLQGHVPPAFLATIPRGRAWGWDGVVITPDDRVLLDVSVTFKKSPTDHPALWQMKYPRLRRLEGEVAVISTVAVDNYFHWLFDALPRLDLVDQAGRQPDFLCLRQETAFQRDSTAWLGLDPARILPTGRDFHIEAASLLVPSYPGMSGEVPKWVCEFLRRKFLAHPPAIAKRLYLTRAGGSYRQVTNEPEVRAALEARGFEVVYPERHSFREQVELCAGAEAIVAPHGAALSNLAFCQPGMPVVEIFSPAYVNPVYWGVANHMQLRYGALLGRGPLEPEAHDVGRAIEVNVAELLALLDQVQAAA